MVVCESVERSKQLLTGYYSSGQRFEMAPKNQRPISSKAIKLDFQFERASRRNQRRFAGNLRARTFSLFEIAVDDLHRNNAIQRQRVSNGDNQNHQS